MDDRERYLFDLSGFLHIPGLLSTNEAQRLYEAAVELEEHALACRHESPPNGGRCGGMSIGKISNMPISRR